MWQQVSVTEWERERERDRNELFFLYILFAYYFNTMHFDGVNKQSSQLFFSIFVAIQYIFNIY